MWRQPTEYDLAVNVTKLKRVSVIEVPPTLNVVQVWTIDAPTMENFLQDLAKERPVLKRSLLDKRAKAQFMAEVSTIGRTYHINLVRLYGFSYNNSLSAIVYEYMENGSLDKHLFNDDTQGIDWNKLPQIAIGIARKRYSLPS
ncbi:hypothetical protein Vadar_001792 [Vaccinium darrowii]|uniref:Uncharacterized protein n=1 Tax=Vaccinium darrowii TaxID=229202 RepID=A0ACB7WX59_9ERIC|nr:hypothetical protein Vadar_001792 [Vaccinium darrowii]